MAEPYLLPTVPERKGFRPPALIPLISICLSELRGDFARIFDSNWADAPRRRARELISTLEEACERQGLQALAVLFRSMMGLMALSREEAPILGPAIREKLEELLGVAERLVTEHSRRQTA